MNILLLTQNGCGPCDLVKNYLHVKNVDHFVVNVSENPEAVGQYEIMSTPVVILRDDNDNEISRVNGLRFDDIDAIIGQLQGASHER